MFFGKLMSILIIHSGGYEDEETYRVARAAMYVFLNEELVELVSFFIFAHANIQKQNRVAIV